MRKVAKYIGGAWLAVVIALGVWLGFSGAFLNVPGLVFQDGYGDIWILALVAAPGYFLWKWGNPDTEK